jgi:hypothetical protein
MKIVHAGDRLLAEGQHDVALANARGSRRTPPLDGHDAHTRGHGERERPGQGAWNARVLSGHANSAPKRRKVTTLAPVKLRDANRSSGIIGDAARASTRTKIASSSRPPRIVPTVSGWAVPRFGDSTSP